MVLDGAHSCSVKAGTTSTTVIVAIAFGILVGIGLYLDFRILDSLLRRSQQTPPQTIGDKRTANSIFRNLRPLHDMLKKTRLSRYKGVPPELLELLLSTSSSWSSPEARFEEGWWSEGNSNTVTTAEGCSPSTKRFVRDKSCYQCSLSSRHDLPHRADLELELAGGACTETAARLASRRSLTTVSVAIFCGRRITGECYRRRLTFE